MRNRAFTLIELLVVIAIIAILAAILFPVFAQAKVAAKKAVDVSNVKQITLASVMYLTDHDDTFPYSMGWADHNCDSWGGPGPSWFTATLPYIKTPDIFITPNDPRPRTKGAFEFGGVAGVDYRLNSYAPNYLLMGWPHQNQGSISATWDRGRTTNNMSGVDRPANTVMVQLNLNRGTWPCWESVQVPNSGTWFSRRNNFYNGGGNFGVTDGHAQFVRIPNDAFASRTLGNLSHYPFGVE